MQESLFSQGLDLMIYGMGTVMVFLAVLVVVTYAMSNIVTRFFPEPVEPERPRPKAQVKAGVDPQTVKVIQEAINLHRTKLGR